MKRSLAAGIVLAVVLAASPSFAAKKNFKANIEGGALPGTGTGLFTFDDVTKKLCGKATFTGLTGGAVTAAALKNANDQTLVRTLTPSASPIVVEITLTDEEIVLLEADGPGDLYIAIGNATFPVSNEATENGEVNGELEPDSPGVDQPCSGADTDAGTNPDVDSGATSSSSSSSGSSGMSSGDTSSSSGSSGDPGEEDDVPRKKPVAKDDGCSTTGSASSGGAVLAALVALFVAGRGRSRRRSPRS
jgi:MYXO-CTERM domain-containing protein